MTAAWDLTVKWPFTDQPDKEGYEKTSTTLVSCESSNDQSSKTIRGTVLHKTARLRARQERGLWDVLTESQAFGQGRPGVLPTAKVKLPRSCHRIMVRQSMKM